MAKKKVVFISASKRQWVEDRDVGFIIDNWHRMGVRQIAEELGLSKKTVVAVADDVCRQSDGKYCGKTGKKR